VAKTRRFLRENPQVAVLAVIALVLGIGTFVAVLVALATAGSTTTDGEPSGAVQLVHVFASTLPLLPTS
jgi:hypothetical protein